MRRRRPRGGRGRDGRDRRDGPERYEGPERREGPFPPSVPKQPVPEHGIRARRFGATWWGQRWIGALHRLGTGYELRLGRGRSYARQGRVHDLQVARGAVQARVTGSRVEPYEVTIRLAPLADSVWDRAIRVMAERAVFAARLLAGEMPRDVDEIFRRSGRSLFPAQAHDLSTACSCPDAANPCKHVAAVHYVLGEFLDRDPFLLFLLRGRAKDEVVDALRRLRTGAPAGQGGGEPRRPQRPGTVVLPPVPPERYDLLRAPVDDLRFRIEAPAVEGAVPRQLGPPRSWALHVPPREWLQPLVARAAELARELAFGESAEPRPDDR
jgi:uncharacterized Zn finger protein